MASNEDDAGYEELGCFPKEVDDTENKVTLLDRTCMSWKNPTLCRSGLPFFRETSNDPTPQQCYSFCTRKGLDIFAIVDGQECRCGASVLNTAVWLTAPRKGMLLDRKRHETSTRTGCRIRAYRYVGYFASGFINRILYGPYEMDVEYVDSIASGRRILSSQEEGVRRISTPATLLQPSDEAAQISATVGDAQIVETQDVGATSQALIASQADDADGADPVGWKRNCWPNSCGPGAGGQWKTRHKGALDSLAKHHPYEDLVIIRYFFAVNVDAQRKEVFREAVDTLRRHTCINFVEKEVATESKNHANVEVGIWDKLRCYADGIGFPGATSRRKINVGWCSNMRHLGNVMHELLHAVGMNNEQQRPDAYKMFQGKGPHLIPKWDKIPDRGEWKTDEKSYTGSGDDGRGDPHKDGYAQYDFDSIMQDTTEGGQAVTIPANAAWLTGNREHLTPDDMEALNDMYQCKKVTNGVVEPKKAPTVVVVPTKECHAIKSGNAAWCTKECNGISCHRLCNQKCRTGCSCVGRVRTVAPAGKAACAGLKSANSFWCSQSCNGKDCHKKCAEKCTSGCSCVDWDASTLSPSKKVVNVLIGPSRYNERCVDLKIPVTCQPDAGDKGKRLNSDWANVADTFSISTPGGIKVCARRSDNPAFGWGMKLKIACYQLTAAQEDIAPVEAMTRRRRQTKPQTKPAGSPPQKQSSEEAPRRRRAAKKETPPAKLSYEKIGSGYCNWNYVSGGKVGVAQCAKKCRETKNCVVFTYGASLGCRYSKCGSDPGPSACPVDKQCPTAGPEHGGQHHTKYQLKQNFKKIGGGYCDWHYVDGGLVGVYKCAKLCEVTPACAVFTYGDSLGCRFSQCGKDPGPTACPKDNQCPTAGPDFGGKYHTKYRLTTAPKNAHTAETKAAEKEAQAAEKKAAEKDAQTAKQKTAEKEEKTAEKKAAEKEETKTAEKKAAEKEETKTAEKKAAEKEAKTAEKQTAGKDSKTAEKKAAEKEAKTADKKSKEAKASSGDASPNEKKLWPQHGHDNQKCTVIGEVKVENQWTCQKLAMEREVKYYQYMDEPKKMCATVSQCDVPIEDADKPWKIYKKARKEIKKSAANATEANAAKAEGEDCLWKCGDKKGYCSHCDENGIKGVCCKLADPKDPDECKNVHELMFKHAGDYHECVLLPNVDSMNTTEAGNTTSTTAPDVAHHSKGNELKDEFVAVIFGVLIFQIALVFGFYQLVSAHYLATYPDFTKPAVEPQVDDLDELALDEGGDVVPGEEDGDIGMAAGSGDDAQLSGRESFLGGLSNDGPQNADRDPVGAL